MDIKWAAGSQKGPYNKIWKFERDAYLKNSIYLEPFLQFSITIIKDKGTTHF